MATRKVDASGLRAVVNEYFLQFGNEAYRAIEDSCAEVAKDIAKELRKGGSYQTHKTGQKFNKGWTTEVQTGRLASAKVRMAQTIVYNKNIPGLAHLLEFGHAKRNGGRTRAFNFIAPVVDTVESRFESVFEKNFNKDVT